MKKIILFFKESAEELRKVVWPTREVLIKHTIIVLVSVSMAMLILSVIDYGLVKLVELAVQNSK